MNEVWKQQQKEICFWIKQYTLTRVSKAACQGSGLKLNQGRGGKATDDFP